MSTTMQLSELMAATRQQCDQENSQFISDSELTSYINQSAFELYDLLVQVYGDHYYVAPPLTFQTTTAAQYDLPNGTNYSAAPAFYKLLGVDLQLSPGSQASYITLKPFNFAERNRYATPSAQNFYGVTNLHYRVNGSQIWFTPTPQSGQTIQLWYIPRLSTLTNPTDTLDGISGWTEYVIVDAALKCLAKEESDVTVMMARKQGLIQRIQAAANNRDAGQTATVADTQMAELDPFGIGMGWY